MTIEVDTPRYKIENKPVLRPRVANDKYPFNKMKIGQSFYIDMAITDVQAVRSAASQYGRRNPEIKFSIIREGTGYRCGRIK